MPNIILVLLIGLAVICLTLPEKKMMANGCDRPSVFTIREDVEKYINCIKALSSDHRYGKRSQPPTSNLLLKHLLPSLYFDHGFPANRDRQELYEVLKYDEN